MKKKLISIVLSLLLMLICMPLYAFAVVEYSIDIAADGTEVRISGTATDNGVAQTGKDITLRIADSSSRDVLVDQVTAGAKGAYSFGPYTLTNGRYTAYVGGIGKPQTKGFSVTGEQLSSNANLSALVLSNGALSPSFASNVTNYSTIVPNSTTSITVTPTKEQTDATIFVNGTPVTSGQASDNISLKVGTNTITVLVTAQNGTTKTYLVNIIRAIPPVTSGQVVPVEASTPIAVTIPVGVSNAKLQATVVGNSATLPTVSAQAETTLGTVKLEIPSGTTVTGPAGWDGKITLPTVQANNSVTDVSGSVSAVIEVGLADAHLTFSKAVRLVVPGQAGKAAAFKRGNAAPVNITRVISADTQAAADTQIPPGGEGKLDVGPDLVIWTKHFTKFIAYTPPAGGGGGGGGGGGSASSDMTVGTSGGTVKEAGVTIEFPANAVTASTIITIKKETGVSLPIAANEKLISDIFNITKDKTGDFAKPVKITLPFDKNKVDASKYDIGIYWYNEDKGELIKLDNTKVDLTNGKVNGEINHFSKFAVIATATVKADEQPVVESNTNLSDISGHWAEKTIEDMVQRGIAKGYPDSTFKPNNNITRAEFAVMVVRAFNLAPQEGNVFADTVGHWAQKDISTAAANGIVSGIGDNNFGPNNLITREQMAAIMIKAVKLTAANEETTFADNSNISAWAKTSLATAVKHGIIKGYPDNTVKPKGNATRAEAVTVISNALNFK